MLKKALFSTLLLTFVVFCAYGQNKFTERPQSPQSTRALEPKPVQDLHSKSHVDPVTKNITYRTLNTLDIQDTFDQGFRIRRKSASGKITLIQGDCKALPTISQNAMNFMGQVHTLLMTDPADTEFRINKITEDNLGMNHVRLNQYHKGIRVYDAEMLLHGETPGVSSLHGQYATSESLPDETNASISKDEARRIVMDKLDNYREGVLNLKNIGLDISARQWQEELVYYRHKENYLLAWFISVYANLAEHYNYFVDARSGKVLHHYSTICSLHGHAHQPPPDGPATASATDLLGLNRLINTYELTNNFYLIDASRSMYSVANSVLPNEPVGVIWTIDAFNTAPQNDNFTYDHVSSQSNDWNGSPEAVSAHFNGGEAYSYFKNVFGRESINSEGGNIISFVNVAGEDGFSMGNAFWNGFAMFYGNGDDAFFPLGRGLDVAGHELTHGVVQETANLEYYGESGAMNESFADIFGVMIDRDDWKIGEDVVKTSVFPSGALRDMADPHNGAQTGNFGAGWQPSHVNEQFTGPEDNNGVHINSGIPNHAFYLFATSVGKDVAENVFYRALTTYLTKSSKFNDLRFAVVQSASDLYNNDVVNAARSAFDQVGIVNENAGNYETDLETNPGQQFILYSNPGLTDLILMDAEGNVLANPLSSSGVISKPSVTDDGENILFVGSDKKIHNISIDWQNSTFQENVIQEDPIWRNVVVAKDGSRIAAIDENYDNFIWVFDFGVGAWNSYELYNPTFTEGVTTGEVLYADALEFDITGNTLIYDAINRVESNSSGTLEYWDIGFLEVWNAADNTWALGRIAKLFAALPEGISVGNPTFSKNSPFIIAMDYLEGQEYKILGVNIEKGVVGEIYSNLDISYPAYSTDDSQMLFDSPFLQYIDLGILNLNADKISTVPNSEQLLIQDARWGVWFSNGSRDLVSSTEENSVLNNDIRIFPNPVDDILTIEFNEGYDHKGTVDIFNTSGQRIATHRIGQVRSVRLPVESLQQGVNFIRISDDNGFTVKRVVRN